MLTATETRMSRARAYRRSDLVSIATEAMLERGLESEFPSGVPWQLTTIAGAARDTAASVRSAD